MSERAIGRLAIDHDYRPGMSWNDHLVLEHDPNMRVAFMSNSPRARTNARRIVALWNAAEELGLTTEAIEAGAIQSTVWAAEAAQEVLMACVVPAGGCDDADVLASTKEQLAVALAPIIGVRT